LFIRALKIEKNMLKIDTIRKKKKKKLSLFERQEEETNWFGEDGPGPCDCKRKGVQKKMQRAESLGVEGGGSYKQVVRLRRPQATCRGTESRLPRGQTVRGYNSLLGATSCCSQSVFLIGALAVVSGSSFLNGAFLPILVLNSR